MHNIYMVEDHKPKAQQHFLNHVMKEVPRKEVVKLFYVAILNLYKKVQKSSTMCSQEWRYDNGNKKNDKLIPTRIVTGGVFVWITRN